MATTTNSAMTDHWNGDEGEFWAEEQERWDHLNSAFNGHMYDRAAITAADRVLDIGCGNGETTRIAARHAPEGRAVGLDVSAPMLDIARSLAERDGLSNVEFVQGDAQIHPFADGEFDVIISRFGLMFFDDPYAAMANIGRATRPGGRFAAIVHGDPTQTDWPMIFGAVQEQLDLPWVKPPAENAMADPEQMGKVMEHAGFTGVSYPHVLEHRSWGTDAADVADFLLAWTPMKASLSQVDAETSARAREACIKALRPFETAEGVVMRTPAWVLSATKS